jgi:6-phosphogluconolactonase
VPDPQGRFAVAADLGLDCLFVYPLDRPGLVPLEDATVRLPKGEGPRHLVFHPRLPMAYLSTEYGNRVYAFRYDSDRGRLDAVQALSTLPPDVQVKSYCADIRLSADGSILLVSNRGHDSIACFRVDADGSLAALGRQSTFGSWPRGFALLGNDRFLVVADQKDDLLVSIRFDPEHPQAHPISRLAIPAPTWVSAM